jgi:glycosyltransferase involved in cell wall biosynthesis
MAFLTVFTPAYNRAHTLPRTYESLLAQDCKDFIWLIVDDGSADNTAELVRSWQEKDNGFEIRYIYKENGGMHTAHNTAYEHIDTELNTCIDSDDKLAPGAVEKILKKWEQVKDQGYAGIIALDSDFDGNVIGKGFPEGLTETTVIGYYAAGGSGDKKLVYRTDVINQYPPYPVFEGEKYVSLAYKYRLIDQTYKMAVLDEILCNVEYQPDGSSGTMWKQYLKNPKGWMFWRKVQMQYPYSTKRLVIDCIHYSSSSIIAKDSHFITESPRKLLTLLCAPLGALLTIYIKRKVRKNEDRMAHK